MAAPKTVLTYPLNGALKDFTIPFEYLARKFVVVTLVGATRRVLVLNSEYRFTTKTQITTTAAWGPTQGFDLIEIRRVTSATERLVDFSDGSILRAYDLNTAQVQSLHIAEEARDLTADTIGVNNDGNLDARGRRIVNVADAVDDGDAITLRQQKSWAATALNYSIASSQYATASANSATASIIAKDNSVNAAGASQASATASQTSRLAAEAARDAAVAQVGLATTQANSAAAQVALATTQASNAASSATAATSNGAAQVALATTQAGIATTKAAEAAASAASVGAITAQDRSFRNLIINGDFNIWQQSFTQNGLQGIKSADKWGANFNGSTMNFALVAHTVGQTAVPGNPRLHMRATTSSVANAANFCIMQHQVEFVSTAQGQPVTLSFWAKADATKDIAIEFGQYFGTGGSPSASVYTIGVTRFTLTTSWQKFTLTVTLPSIAGRTVGTTINDYLTLRFWLEAGSNWNANTASLGQRSGVFDFSRVQLEESPFATPFEVRPYTVEMELAQRFFEVTQGTNSPTQGIYVHRPYRVIKRAVPTVWLASGSTAGGDLGPYGMFSFRTPAGTAATSNADWTVFSDCNL